MSGEQNYDAAKALEKHLVQIDEYIKLSNCKFSSYQEEFLMVSDLDPYELDKKSKDELFDIAYLLYSYSGYLQDEVNRHQVIINWCNNQLDRLLSKYERDNNFDKYTKYETKKFALIGDNSYADKVDYMRLIAESRLTTLEGKIFQIKRQGDVILEKAKRK